MTDTADGPGEKDGADQTRVEDNDQETKSHHHGDPDTLGVALLTVSTSRTLAEDAAGDAAFELLESAGHTVVTRDLVPDDHDRIQTVVDTFVGRDDTDCIVTTGGTGVTPDDQTVGAVRPLFDRELPGFGELFRSMSREQVGSRAMLSRATAGVADAVPVFVLPGSEDAVRLAVTELVIPEAPHIVGMATREQ